MRSVYDHAGKYPTNAGNGWDLICVGTSVVFRSAVFAVSAYNPPIRPTPLGHDLCSLTSDDLLSVMLLRC